MKTFLLILLTALPLWATQTVTVTALDRDFQGAQGAAYCWFANGSFAVNGFTMAGCKKGQTAMVAINPPSGSGLVEVCFDVLGCYNPVAGHDPAGVLPGNLRLGYVGGSYVRLFDAPSTNAVAPVIVAAKVRQPDGTVKKTGVVVKAKVKP